MISNHVNNILNQKYHQQFYTDCSVLITLQFSMLNFQCTVVHLPCSGSCQLNLVGFTGSAVPRFFAKGCNLLKCSLQVLKLFVLDWSQKLSYLVSFRIRSPCRRSCSLGEHLVACFLAVLAMQTSLRLLTVDTGAPLPSIFMRVHSNSV